MVHSPALHSATRRPINQLLMVLVVLSVLLSSGVSRSVQARPYGATSAQTGQAQTVTRFNTSEPVIALTFDTDTVAGNEAAILDTLAAKGVRATFAVTGSWVSREPEMLKRMVREGHALINHSWSHPRFSLLSSEQRAAELQQTENLVREVAGVGLQPFFRPPYGDFNASVLADLAANGYTVNVWWTIDSDGWRGLSAGQIVQRVSSLAVPGAIVLMHSGTQTQDVVALPVLIDQLRAQGYTFTTVPDFFGGVPAAEPPVPEYRLFPETGHTVGHAFLAYWMRYGGVEIFGYPLTEELQQDSVTVQYFERARFEYRPGAAPERYDVLLSLLGDIMSNQRRGTAAFHPIPGASGAQCTFVAETHHQVCFGFRDYWMQHGGIPIFGYPLSEELQENGVTMQYFERARFEYHPENPPAYVIVLGRLGAEVLRR